MEKIPFRKRGDILTTYTPTGTKWHITYEVHIDEHGHKTLHESGKEDQYAKIQEHAESCEIENIIARYNMGDKEVLNKVKGQYADITEMPTSLAEAQNKILAIKNEFYKLPIDVRREFGMSPEAYVQQYGSSQWATKMGFVEEKKLEEALPEIKTNEEVTE